MNFSHQNAVKKSLKKSGKNICEYKETPCHKDGGIFFGSNVPTVKISSITQLTSDKPGYLTVIRTEQMSGEYSAEDSSIMYLIESIIKELNDETIENVFMSKISSYGQNLIDSLSNNNGISTTASEIKTSTADDGTLLITSFTNLQIINGGQTTATLAITSIKNNADLSGIYVQMKLTVLKELIGKKILFEYIGKVISDQI